MARIESGIKPQEAGQFWLKGQEMGLGQAQQQHEDSRRREAEMHDYMMQIQKAALEHKKEELRSQMLLNQQAQMGDAQSLQQLAMNVKAGEHPDAGIIKDAMGTMARISDPKARAIAMQAFHSAMGDLQKQRQRGAADQALERATTNGLIKPEDADSFKQRMDTGESPQNITQELHKTEQENNIKTMAMDKSAEALPHMEALLQSAPPGHRKIAAGYIFTHFKNDLDGQAKPGYAEKALEEMQMALLPSQKEMDDGAASKKQRMQEMLGPNSQAPGMGGMTTGERASEMENEPHGPFGFGAFGDSFGSGGPDIPPLDQSIGTHATLRGKKGKSPAKPVNIAQVFGAAKTAQEFHAALQQMGVDPNSDEGAALIIQALGGGDGQPDD